MKKADTFIPPDWLDSEAWADFEAHRREIKKPLTDRARELAVKKLTGMSKEAQRETINRAIENRWIALYPRQDRHWPLDTRPSPPVVKREKMSDGEWRRRQKTASEKLKELRRHLGKVL